MSESATHLSHLLEVRFPGAPPLPKPPTQAFAASFAAAYRLGRSPVALTDAERARLAGAGIALPPDLALDELGRMAMLVALADRAPGPELEAVVDDCYQRGDNRERRAVLRALPLLPAPERFLRVGVDACRTHVLPVFEAIACDNPYPALHFPELNYNQMVLKALFLGVSLGRIAGLDARTTPELARMAHDYASERRAAGRSVPDDIPRFFGGESAPRRSS